MIKDITQLNACLPCRISVLNIHIVLKRVVCRCEKKMLQVNEIVGFVGLIFFLNYLIRVNN